MRWVDLIRYSVPAVFAVCLGCSGVGGGPPAPSTQSSPTALIGPLTGTWSGPLRVTTPLGQPDIAVTATLNHTINNSQSTITGSVTLSNTSCVTPTTLLVQAATFQAPGFSLDVPTGDGTFRLSGRTLDSTTLDAQFEIRGGTCNGATGAGVLRKQPTASPTGLVVFFQIDQRLVGGTYGGPLWVAPPTFTLAGAVDTCPVAARAVLVTSTGSVDVTADWRAANPVMVAVSPTKGHQVAITVQRLGQSNLTVTSQGTSRTLVVTAAPSVAGTIICTFAGNP